MLGWLGTPSGTRPRLWRVRRDRGQAGVALIEVLVTVLLMGTTMVAFCTGMFMVVKTSETTQRAAILEADLRRLAEAMRATPYSDSCDSGTEPNYLAMGLYPAPPSWSIVAYPPAIAVDHWNGSGTAGSSYTAACPVDGDHGVQRLNLTVTDKANQLTASTEIVKREN